MEERKARGQFCGFHNGYPVYYSRPHFIVGKGNREFVRFLSQKEARKNGLTELPGKNSSKIYGPHGYIGPDRLKGKDEASN